MWANCWPPSAKRSLSSSMLLARTCTRRRRSGGDPERGALASPSAPTSTSTRHALVTLQLCQAWHGRGLNEVPAGATRVINNCREAMYGELWKWEYPYTNTRISARPVRYAFCDCILADTHPTRGGGGVCEMFFGERGYGRISGGTRVL
jgi:hypothetical protein